ncbi:uncharacterized protein LOC111085322 [Limulus polyphemus]|uniref:Uncharacterized protein LOC111085322 n=1 Tax=Limulus polyphemus TaxID=6850 RepID=A0ABM1S642_LIMPO|nr:uncharacterized protein LOC111085322 [Limulus polyphemus]
MNRSDRAGNVHVPISPSVLATNGLILPVQDHKHLPVYCAYQWSKANHFNRYPRPLLCDRLQRLPPPRSFIASAGLTDELNSALSYTHIIGDRKEMDLKQKIHQLEKNLAFVKEQHALVLHSLLQEVEELKEKNRELQFQLTMGTDKESKSTQKSCCNENRAKNEKLEKELKKLRSSLKDALKSNTALVTQVQLFKREQYLNASSIPTVSYQPIQFETCSEGMTKAPTPSGPSPKMDEYKDTIRQIDQVSARPRVSRNYNNGYHGDRFSKDKSGYVDNRGRQNQHQRLPRLPLRNHSNMPHQQ